MAETFSVQAILSAVDKGFRKTMREAKEQAEGFGNENKKANTSMLDIAKGVGVFKLVEAGVSAVKNSLGGAISRFDTLNNYTTVMEALGHSTEDVDLSMKKMVDGIDGLPTKLDDIADSTQQFAIATGDLDKGTDTAIALNNAFLASGKSSAEAARGAEQYRQMLARGEVDMQSWRSVVDTMPIAMDKVAKSFEDRGVKSTEELYDALKAGDITFDEFNDRLIELNEGVGGFAELAHKNSAGIKTAFTNLGSAMIRGVETVIRSIDEKLKELDFGSISDILNSFKGQIDKFFGFVAKNIPFIIDKLMEGFKVIEKVAEALKPYTPILVEIVAILVTFRVLLDIKKMVLGVMSSFKLFFGVLAANPIVLLISVIVALIGSFIYLWKTNEGFRNAIIEIWTAIKDFFANLWGNMKATATKFWQDTKDTAIETFTGMRDGLKEIWDSTKQFFVDIWNGIKDFATGLWNGMKEKASEIFNGMKDTLSETWTKTKDKSSEIWNNTKAKASEIWGNTKSSVVTIAGGLKDGVLTAWDSMKSGTSKAMGKVKTVLKSLGEVDLFQIGKDVINGFVEGIKNMMRAVKDAVSNIASTVTDGLKGALKIKSPSRVMMGISKWIPAGVAKGIEDNTKQVDKAMANMVDTDLVNPIADDLNNAFTSVGKTSLSNEMNINHSNQPAYINLSLGGQNFKAFVDNIGSTMGQEADLLAQY